MDKVTTSGSSSGPSQRPNSTLQTGEFHWSPSNAGGSPLAAGQLVPPGSALDRLEERVNPFTRTDLPADVREYSVDGPGKVSRNEFGQPCVRTKGLEILVSPGTDIVEANRRALETPPVGSHTAVFHDPRNVLPLERVVNGAQEHFSGGSLTDAAQFRAGVFGAPLPCRPTSFVCCMGRKWMGSELGCLTDPLKNHEGSAVVPMLGELRLAGRPLSDEILAQLGIYRASLSSGQDAEAISLPLFVQGGRSVLIFGRFQLPVTRSPEGGFLIVQTRAELEQIPPGEVTFLRGPAVQFTGVGIQRYVCHATGTDARGRARLGPGDVIIEGCHSDDRTVLVQDTRNAGAAGILLDTRHQPMSCDPTGGLYDGAHLLDVDALLFRLGAEMSSLTFGYTELLRKEDLDRVLNRDSGMVSPAIHIVRKLVLDDSHRLNVLLVGEATGRTPSPAVKMLIERDYGSYSEAARDAYVAQVSSTIGHNLKICLGAELTVAREESTAGNLSIYGRIADAENFLTLQNRYEALPLIKAWLTDVCTLASHSGIPLREYLGGPAFFQLASNLIGPERAQPLQRRLAASASRGTGAAGVELAAEWALHSLAAEGKTVGSAALLKLLATSSALQNAVGFTGNVDLKSLKTLLSGGGTTVGILSSRGTTGFSGGRRRETEAEFLASLRAAYVKIALVANQPSLFERRNAAVALLPELDISAEQRTGKQDQRNKRGR